MSKLGLATGVFLGCLWVASPAQAQDLPSSTVYFDFGSLVGVPSERIVATSRIRQEDAEFVSRLNAPYGTVLELGAGTRFWGGIGAAFALGIANGKSSGRVEIELPHPSLFNRPASDDTGVFDLKRTEVAMHFGVLTMFQVSDSSSVSLTFGPSYFDLQQMVGSYVDITERFSGSTYIIDIADTYTSTLSGTAWGFHSNFDFAWYGSRNIGFGFHSRYSTGKAKLDTEFFDPIALSIGSGRQDTIRGDTVHVGGFQFGAGVRLRF